MEAAGGKLAENVVHFAHVLRAAGIPVGPGAVLDGLAALDIVGLRERDDVFCALQAVFVKRADHLALFEQAFDLYFRKRGYLDKLAAALAQNESAPAPSDGKPLSRRVAEAFGTSLAAAARSEAERDARDTVSDLEVLQRKDFAEMSAAEIADAKRRIALLARTEDRVAMRRFGPDPRGPRIDPRASFRAGLRSAGDLVPLSRRARRQRPPPIVAIVDVSGSMASYSRLFLHFLHALAGSGRRVSAFLFGTRLTNITRALAVRDPDVALLRASATAEDWSGGTRIATSLHAFNKEWSRRVLGQGATVLLFTDGLERDADPGLAAEMDRLHRSCRRLVWLNPLLRFDRFEAKASGIRRMLPHVDEFRPIHNLDTMAGLVHALGANDMKGADPRRYLRAA